MYILIHGDRHSYAVPLGAEVNLSDEDVCYIEDEVFTDLKSLKGYMKEALGWTDEDFNTDGFVLVGE